MNEKATVSNAQLESMGLGKPALPVSGISNSKYSLGASKEIAIKTPQARVCYEILLECLKGKRECTEAELKAKVEEQGVRLKTRQPAWRIFQYYRPQLIQAGLVKRN